MPTLIAAAHRNCRIKIGLPKGASLGGKGLKSLGQDCSEDFCEASEDYYCPTVDVVVVQRWFRAAHRKISMKFFVVLFVL